MKEHDPTDTKWVGIDLHVHTPASSDYKGNRDDREYLELIKRANEFSGTETRKTRKRRESAKAAIACIAFTDHNSVDGFRKYRKLYQDTAQLRDSLQARDPGNAYLTELSKDMGILESVRVLMGIEIKANPGIDLLLIFHESVEPEAVVQFLETTYSRPYKELAGDPTPVTPCTLVDTLTRVKDCFAERAMAVAPHIDSTGGLYEALKEFGQARAAAFRQPSLRALSFNKPETRERVMAMFTQPEYRRPDQVALIQSSDFHGQSGALIGQPRTEVLVPRGKASFSNVREAFNFPARVRCSIDFTQREYEGLTEGKFVLKYSSQPGRLLFCETDYENIAAAVCAMVNSQGGIIELEGVIPGELERDAYLRPVLEQIRTLLVARIQPPVRPSYFRDLRLSPGKVRMLIGFLTSRHIHTFDGTVPVVRNREVRKASPFEIESIVSRNLEGRFGDRYEDTLDEVSTKSTLLSKMPHGISVLLACQEKVQIGLPKGLEVEDIAPATAKGKDIAEEVEDLILRAQEDSPFGDPKGNTTLIRRADPPRAEEHYLRFTAFRCDVDSKTVERCSSGRVEIPVLAVLPRGNVQLIEPSYIISSLPIVLLRPSADWQPKLLSVLSWFKSSFFVWYCAVHLGDPDLFLQIQLVSSRIALPKATEDAFFRQLNDFAHNMVLDENKFMAEVNRLKRKGALDGAQQERERARYNSTANHLCLQLDKAVLSFLGLSKGDGCYIARTLKDIRMTDFGFLAEPDTEE